MIDSSEREHPEAVTPNAADDAVSSVLSPVLREHVIELVTEVVAAVILIVVTLTRENFFWFSWATGVALGLYYASTLYRRRTPYDLSAEPVEWNGDFKEGSMVRAVGARTIGYVVVFWFVGPVLLFTDRDGPGPVFIAGAVGGAIATVRAMILVRGREQALGETLYRRVPVRRWSWDRGPSIWSKPQSR